MTTVPEYLLVMTTTDTHSLAREIARHVVAEKLAACVEIQKIESIYQWQGSLNESDEYLIAMKTRAELYLDLERTISALHTYDLPQIIALPITHGSEGYLAWIRAETRARN